VQRHPLRTLGQVGPNGCDVIAHGIDAVIVCGHPTIFSPAKPGQLKHHQQELQGERRPPNEWGQDDDGGTWGHVGVGRQS